MESNESAAFTKADMWRNAEVIAQWVRLWNGGFSSRAFSGERTRCGSRLLIAELNAHNVTRCIMIMWYSRGGCSVHGEFHTFKTNFSGENVSREVDPASFSLWDAWHMRENYFPVHYRVDANGVIFYSKWFFIIIYLKKIFLLEYITLRIQWIRI